ncbi:hypothetical protein CVT25_009694 [Psilocybe cyanescens]|uniref:Uncharacterized protein n=1 Tax=Psilocybe cyanescens TaxID=93625 RepID=A0A409XNW9_PSICY|nr:hypothetical protein CVT25_009694 [Psilocybe cyanescens]
MLHINVHYSRVANLSQSTERPSILLTPEIYSNCGSNQCGCSVDIQDTLDTCQACVLEEKGHEATEAALNSALGTSSIIDTDDTSSVTVPSISQYQQFCANAGSPITGSPQASNSQLSKGSTGGNVADTAASSPNSVSSGNGNGDAGSPQSKTSDGVPKVVVDIWCVVLLGIVTPYVLA